MVTHLNSAEELAAAWLGKLEQREARLLAWGLVDGSFDEEELYAAAESHIAEHNGWEFFADEAALVEHLRQEGALFAFDADNGSQRRYRTRMAESVRLFARLRQLFPMHFKSRNGWQAAPTLVADFRFLLRPRLFPRLDIAATDVLAAMDAVRPLQPIQRDVVAAMLGMSTDNPMRLRGFQVRAAVSILAGSAASEIGGGGNVTQRGTIVTAGTGSGKTLSFYLPAYADIAATLSSPGRWTRALAIYPRNELLKDQFSEAYQQARRVDAVLARHGVRKMVLGALFGSTPNVANVLPDEWRRTGGGHVCPLLRCPECSGELVWLDVDRSQARERLECARSSCGATVSGDEVVLTRRRMMEERPDVLFTTTEMLNQRLGDSRYGPLLGVGVPQAQSPRHLLLDEVHTFGGVSGAQVALLLRRWRYASRSFPHITGLSATLRNAPAFLATLAGLNESSVEEATPRRDELEPASNEYLLALRGDPASQTGLLSTTIQAAMLLRRVLDPSGEDPSIFGRKLFLFTDDLDVTNRLFFKLRSAEGMDSWGRPNRPEGSLANLRATALPAREQRFRSGQSWDLCERMGHRLQSGVRPVISRTSSQDSGVNRTADIIVATASLEVGYNDAGVGGVLQHKAPRDAAQFLQRKGRAGRRPNMRPWTVVVLSDYGRDRVAYQAYDLLFDPELQPRDLPVGNRYVLRMQAAYAFMDWLSMRLRDVAPGSVWIDLAAPANNPGVRRRQEHAAALIEQVLEQSDRREDLAAYLCESLGVDESTVDALMWEPPRSLLLGVLPTVLRRLRSSWHCPQPDGSTRLDHHAANAPLPEFVPRALFEDLNLPEVVVTTPPQQRTDGERRDSMPILQAMAEFCPGRVSWRFGIRNEYARHWIAPPMLRERLEESPLAANELDVIEYLAQWDDLPYFQYVDVNSGTVADVPCVRPRELRLARPPQQIADSSNAFLKWQTQILPTGGGIPVALPARSRWIDLVIEVRFFTHTHHCPLEVRRFACGADVTLSFDDGRQSEESIRFVRRREDGAVETVGVGFVLDVDGLVVRFRIPPTLRTSLIGTAGNGAKMRALRISRFQDLVSGDNRLDGRANPFVRRWLSEVYVSALCRTALADQTSLKEAHNQLIASAGVEGGRQLREVLEVIFQALPSIIDEDVAVLEDGGTAFADMVSEPSGGTHVSQVVRQRLYGKLVALFTDSSVLEVLHDSATALWLDPDDSWDAWLREKFKSTLGAAVLDAVQQLCPDVGTGELVLDLSPGPQPPDARYAGVDGDAIYLTEATVGGGGVIEKFLARYGEDPRRFWKLVEEALQPGDFEVMDDQLSQLLRWSGNDQGHMDDAVRVALAQTRHAQATSHEDLLTAFAELLALLAEKGLAASHSVVAAINTRVLRAGSTAATDTLLDQLLTRWRREEERLGVEIDQRVFAYACSGESDLDSAIGDVIHSGDAPRGTWRFTALCGLLWPRGAVARGQKLSVFSRYAQIPTPQRELVLDCLGREATIVRVDDSDCEEWWPHVEDALVRDGAVTIRGSVIDRSIVASALLRVMSHPTDTGCILLYPRVQAVRLQGGFVDLSLTLLEAAQ